MKRFITVAVVISCSTVFAQPKDTKAPPPKMEKMDMSTMGPWTRTPKNEGQVKKEIAEFFKQEEELTKKMDLDAMWARIDFPVLMVTDDSRGMVESGTYSREQYIAMMKPMMESMPKDMQLKHKPTVMVLSDNLASVVDDFSMTMGKQKMSGRSASLLVKKDGKWMWKVMSEAGWGGMNPPATGGSGMQQTPPTQPR